MTRAAFHPSPPRDLTIPDLDSTTARAVWSMALRKLFEDLKTLRAPRGASPAAIEDWRTFRRVVSGFLPGRPGAVASLLRRPVVSAPLRCLRDGATPADEAIAEVVGQGLFELALAGALDAEHVLRAPPPFLSAPHRDAHVGGGEDRTVVDAVTDHEGAMTLGDQVLQFLVLLLRKAFRLDRIHPDRLAHAFRH